MGLWLFLNIFVSNGSLEQVVIHQQIPSATWPWEYWLGRKDKDIGYLSRWILAWHHPSFQLSLSYYTHLLCLHLLSSVNLSYSLLSVATLISGSQPIPGCFIVAWATMVTLSSKMGNIISWLKLNQIGWIYKGKPRNLLNDLPLASNDICWTYIHDTIFILLVFY